MACLLSADACLRKHVADPFGATPQGKGWWRLTCPIGHHGQPLRFHTGDLVHISWTDLGKCPETDVYAWLIKKGIPRGCLRRPKGWQAPERAKDFGSEDGELADVILDVALGDGTSTERMIRMVVAALGEVPEGPMVDILADRLRLTPRMIWKATADLRKPR